MALFTPLSSPAVTVKEIDLTGVVPNVATNTGAFVGNFGWEASRRNYTCFKRSRTSRSFFCTNN